MSKRYILEILDLGIEQLFLNNFAKTVHIGVNERLVEKLMILGNELYNSTQLLEIDFRVVNKLYKAFKSSTLAKPVDQLHTKQ